MYNCYNPQETAEIVSRAGVVKGNTRLDKVFFSGVSAGCILSFACATVLSTNTAPWFQDNAPGLIRTISALVFPYGLCIIVLTGADLCTGSFMYTAMAVYHRRLSIAKMLIHWAATFWGNLAGSLFIVAIITGYGGTFDTAGFTKEVQAFAKTKQVAAQWHQVFLRGIGANWLVCLACYLGMSGREYFSKIMGIWWPTFAFVSLGFDHVVANMYFIPIAIWHDTPGISVGLYIWKGVVPAGLGNIVGGALFVAAYYYYQYLLGQESVLIDGVPFGGAGGGMADLGRRPAGDEETLRSSSPPARGRKEANQEMSGC
ncbi:hypothetical protein PV08_01235 [Exophiala spinifera]|uniref:Formate/nitrite transporter n=1 Tax=Exophiala spinifera TaxID=91928 RepID=A0A0D2BP19_9EURO|nr:uncharacterized protein PV08_01235 [Exophiala spinifera]KIW20658.1 hypothetical protein PV08_01235 [Exophiala spinifera]